MFVQIALANYSNFDSQAHQHARGLRMPAYDVAQEPARHGHCLHPFGLQELYAEPCYSIHEKDYPQRTKRLSERRQFGNE